eukprot:5600182-Pyramimonas_sp.AAC.1
MSSHNNKQLSWDFAAVEFEFCEGGGFQDLGASRPCTPACRICYSESTDGEPLRDVTLSSTKHMDPPTPAVLI